MPKTLLGGLSFAEGPRWHDGRLWFSDFYTQKVKAVDLDGVAEDIITVPNQPSGLGWRPDGTMLVVSMLDRRLMAWDGKALTQVADLTGASDFNCNDMVVDGDGRAYVGNFGFDFEKGDSPKGTCLAIVEPDGTVARGPDELMFPNGMVITPDGSTLIVGETWGARLTAFDRAKDGTLSNRRLFAQLPQGVLPDGICLDAEGAVWAASPISAEVVRVREGGEVTDRVSTGDLNAFACMLGGPDRRTLFICAAPASTERTAASDDGCILVEDVTVPGAGLP